MKKLASGLFNDVYLDKKIGIVKKVPKGTGLVISQSLENIREALDVHRMCFSGFLPATSVFPCSDSPLGYVMEQRYIPGKRLAVDDLRIGSVKKDVAEIFYRGNKMERDHGLFFDPYGINDYAKNSAKWLVGRKDFVLGNIIVCEGRAYYVDVGYVRTDSVLGYCSSVASDLMNNFVLKF